MWLLIYESRPPRSPSTPVYYNVRTISYQTRWAMNTAHITSGGWDSPRRTKRQSEAGQRMQSHALPRPRWIPSWQRSFTRRRAVPCTVCRRTFLAVSSSCWTLQAARVCATPRVSFFTSESLRNRRGHRHQHTTSLSRAFTGDCRISAAIAFPRPLDPILTQGSPPPSIPTFTARDAVGAPSLAFLTGSACRQAGQEGMHRARRRAADLRA